MSAVFTFGRIPGVRACLVGDVQGRLLEETSEGADNSALVAAAAALAIEGERLGSLLGLGSLDLMTTKAPKASWVIGTHSEWTAAIQLEHNGATGPVEAALRGTEWHSLVEWDVSTSEIECVTPGDAEKGASRGGQAPAEAPPRPSTPTPDESGLKWRAAPKYRQVLMRSNPEAREFAAKEAPTCPFPAQSVLPDAAIPAADELANAPIFAGNLRVFGFADLLEFLGNARRTGALTCSSHGRTGKIHLRSGKVIAAASPGTKPLREYLIATGARVRQLPLPDASSDPSHPQLAVTLVERGFVTAAEAREALDVQLRDAIADLLTWSEGEFSFDPDRAREPSPLESTLEFDPQGLLLEIFRMQDERGNVVSRGG